MRPLLKAFVHAALAALLLVWLAVSAALAIPPAVTHAATAAVAPYDESDRAIRAAIAEKSVRAQPWRIVARHPHDPEAFTQGLVHLPGAGGRRSLFIESLGRYGSSELRTVDPASGKPLARRPMDRRIFLEGAAVLDGRVYALTWQERAGFIWSWPELAMLGKFDQHFEGWGLTTDGSLLVASDGSNVLRFLAPPQPGGTLAEARRIAVTAGGRPVAGLNELEYAAGKGGPVVYANVFTTNWVVAIDPRTGGVQRALDLSPLVASLTADARPDVLNGIAFDSATGRLFVTGKLWPTLFEIELTEN